MYYNYDPMYYQQQHYVKYGSGGGNQYKNQYSHDFDYLLNGKLKY